MSEFEEALTRAVQEGAEPGRLPGAADAVRRGRRRTLRARTGTAVLGVAALGGALGVTSVLGGGAGAAASAASGTTGTTGITGAALAATTTGSPASAPTSAPAQGGDGLLPAKQWPGYNVVHWDPQLVQLPNGGGPTKMGSLALRCYPAGVTPDPKDMTTFPVEKLTQWGVEYNTSHHVDADQMVLTFADEAKAGAFLADARTAGSVPNCVLNPKSGDTRVAAQGASTDDGVSWTVTQPSGAPGLAESVDHWYVVQSGNRVSMFRVMQFGDDFKSTAGDKTVLQDLEAALRK